MYETGVGIAFLIWLWFAVINIVLLNSQFERNLNKIGQRLSVATMSPKPMANSDRPKKRTTVLKYLFVSLSGLVFIFFSWVYVAGVLGAIAYRAAKNSGKPQLLREFEWRLRNTNMTFDEIVRALMKAGEIDPAKFDEFRDEIVQGMTA